MSNSFLRLMLVDDDPVFRLGLRIWLEQIEDFSIVAEATIPEALSLLTAPQQPEDQVADAPPLARQVDVLILDLGLAGPLTDNNLPGLRLCRQIKQRFPDLKTWLLAVQLSPALQAWARRAGADAIDERGLPLEAMAEQIRRISRGESAWDAAAPLPVEGRSAEHTELPGPFTAMRLSLRLSGMQQIEAVLSDLDQQQASPLSPLYRLVVEGRRRELKAARWVVNRLLATPRFPANLDTVRQAGSFQVAFTGPPPPPQSGITAPLATVSPEQSSLLKSPADATALVLEGIFNKLQLSLRNTTDSPLEIDILRPEKKRELLYVALRKFEDGLDELRHSQVQPGQLAERRSQFLLDLWQATTSDFFGRYYTLQLPNLEQPIVVYLLEAEETVQKALLDPIPLVTDVLGHLLFQEPLVVDGLPEMVGSPAAIQRSQALIEHLLIQVTSGVLQPLLNTFADVEAIKKSLYQRQVMSTREIERFRNNLAWRYRMDRLVHDPKDVFESQYRLFTLSERGIQRTSVYSPRRQELDDLSGFPLAVTLVLEARDAIAPRLQATVAFVGSGLVYILTEVVGRGIGLIGRGILQGIGSAWQETRPKRESRE